MDVKATMIDTQLLNCGALGLRSSADLVSSFKYSYCLFTGNSGKVYEEFLK